MCVAIPFVLVTIAPRYISAPEVNLFFLLEVILGPIWVWLIIKEQPSVQTIIGGIVIIITIALHSFLALKKHKSNLLSLKINYIYFYRCKKKLKSPGHYS